MEIGLIYYSKTGHSKKIAEAIASALEIDAKDIQKNPTLDKVDLLFIVGGIYRSKSSPELKEFITTLDSNQIKKAVLMTSCLSKRQKQDEIRKLLKNNKIEVVNEEFICRGNFLFFGCGHPNHEDINAAIDFAKNMISSNK